MEKGMEGDGDRERVDIAVLSGSECREVDIEDAWMFNKAT